MTKPNPAQTDEVVPQSRFDKACSGDVELDVSDFLKQTSDASVQENPTAAKPRLHLLTKLGLGSWLLIWLTLSLLVFACYDVFNTLAQAYQTSPFWAGLMTISIGGLSSVLGYLVFNEIRGFFALRTLEHPLTLTRLQRQTKKEDVIRLLKQRVKPLSPKHSPLVYQLHQRFFQTLQPHYTPQEIIEIYLLNVENPLYKQAQALIQKEAQKVAAATAMLPYSGVQVLLLVYWNFRVVKKVCALYGIKLGGVARAKLIRTLWENILVDAAVDQTVNYAFQGISQNVLGKVLDQTSEALTAALLVYRIGGLVLNSLSISKNLSCTKKDKEEMK